MAPRGRDPGSMTTPSSTVPLRTLIPNEWNAPRVVVRCLRVLCVSKANLLTGPKIVDVDGARAILFFGPLRFTFADMPPFRQTPDDTIELREIAIREREETEAPYLLVVLPLSTEIETRRKLDSVVGLFGLFNGRCMVWEELYENEIEIETNQVSITGPPVRNPLACEAPDLARLQGISAAGKRIAQLPADEQNRIQLSLRWFHDALRDQGVDAFLKYWVAMETLAMPDDTNISPITASLARAYSQSVQTTANEFKVGRLFGIRSRIVHKGDLGGIHAQLEDYVGALYFDVFCEFAGLPGERRARAVLADPSWPARDWFRGPT